MNRQRKVGFIIIITLIGCLALTGYAYAGNGTRMLGFSTRDSAMAGATTASPEDTSCLIKNPAGLVWIGNKIDLQYENIIPHDVKATFGGHVETALGGTTFGNAGVTDKSTIRYLPGGNGGISYRIPGTDKHPISVGCGVFTMSGVAVNYPSSRLNTVFSGNYDKMVDLRSMRIAPGLAVAFNDQLSFGATANINIQALRTDMATSRMVNNRYPQTAGGGDWDITAGGGFTLGLLYKFSKMLWLGTSFESKQWMGHHYKYKDSLPYIDEPPVINAGLSFRPIENFEFTFDTRYINWTNIKVATQQPTSGGFGWMDQWVFATGGEYTFKDKNKNDKLKLRLGYNYGRSPIQDHVVFANSLLPVIMEHHFTTGLSYFLTKSLSLDVAWEHHFKAVRSDDGSGDTYSQYGVGTKVTAAAEVISVGMGYKF